MRKMVFLLFILIFFSTLQASEETLISGNMEHGGFGGFSFRVTSLNGQTVVMSGGGGAWIINSRFFIGGLGFSNMSDDIKAPVVLESEQLFMNINYGGLDIGYVFNPDKLYHVTIDALIGQGSVNYSQRNSDDHWKSDDFFVIEPTVNLEFNIVNWFRLAFGASYRLVTDVEIQELHNNDVSGLSAGVFFKFGKF
ncbi:hypothetical protein JXQ31_02065 [candidate division KSB1 bacterium]|nr:hypothetical protein [candidate division KSB1 bacterium]